MKWSCHHPTLDSPSPWSFWIPGQNLPHCSWSLFKVHCSWNCRWTIHCDYGVNFTSQMFIAFCSNLDISLSYSSSFHHSSNPAEWAVRTVKNIMKKCSDDNLYNSAWKIGLLEYFCTPSSDFIPSPAELLNNSVDIGLSLFSSFGKLISGYKRNGDRQPDLFKGEGKD